MNGSISSRVRWRLTAVYVVVLLFSLFAIGVSLWINVIGEYRAVAQSDLKKHAATARRLIEADPRLISNRAHLVEVCAQLDRDIGVRVIVFDRNGERLADSRAGSREGRSWLRVQYPLYASGDGRRKQIGVVELRLTGFEPKMGIESLRFRHSIILTLLLTAILAGLVVYRLAGKIADPVARMNEMAKAMAAGDLDQRVDVTSSDEIGQLARSLNDLARQLGTTIDELADHRSRMETILASMTDGIIVTDEQGRVVVFNQACERFLHKTPGEVLNATLRNADLHPQIAAMVEESVSSGNITRREIRLPGREETVLGATASSLRHSSGKVIGSVMVLHDLTEVRKHEKAEREFVANVSHELRTPITAIRVTAEALISGAKDDAKLLDRFTNSLLSESERLSALIDDLLELAKRDAGQKPLEKTRLPLVSIGERACEYWEPQAKHRGLTLECDIPKDVYLCADERQMDRMLDNLLSNAIKYTLKGGKVTVSVAEVDRFVEISVADTGIGIPQGDIARIFERFYRVDRIRSRQLGSTGLGLPIVKDIVESHGGSVRVESELGKGSTFTVAIPKWVDGVEG